MEDVPKSMIVVEEVLKSTIVVEEVPKSTIVVEEVLKSTIWFIDYRKSISTKLLKFGIYYSFVIKINSTKFESEISKNVM